MSPQIACGHAVERFRRMALPKRLSMWILYPDKAYFCGPRQSVRTKSRTRAKAVAALHPQRVDKAIHRRQIGSEAV